MLDNVGSGIGVVILVFAALMIAGLRIARDTERFAVTVMGRFKELKGPGVVLKWPGSSSHWTRLRLAQRGEFVGEGWARFEDVSVPVRMKEELKLGESVRISSFQHDEVCVEPDTGSSRTVRCERCGHEMQV